jgi:hypothetical protein
MKIKKICRIVVGSNALVILVLILLPAFLISWDFFEPIIQMINKD